jgi:hypothetical protein
MARKPMDVRVSHLGHDDLSHDDVVHLVGDLEDNVIASILATGATYEEIEQAVKWLGASGEERLHAHSLTPTAELVYDILLSSGKFNSDEERMNR